LCLCAHRLHDSTGREGETASVFSFQQLWISLQRYGYPFRFDSILVADSLAVKCRVVSTGSDIFDFVTGHEGNPYFQALDFSGGDPELLNRSGCIVGIDGASRSQNRLHINEHQCVPYRIRLAQGFPPGRGAECRDDRYADERDYECPAYPWDRLWYARNFRDQSSRQRFAGEGGGGIDRPSRLLPRCKKRI